MRMYFFVNMYLSPIQKGIQAGHCVEQYVQDYGDTKEYRDYIDNHKTWIILNGGSTTHISNPELGTMNEYAGRLAMARIPYAVFEESYLADTLTAICFLCPEQVYNREKYPEFREWLVSEIGERVGMDSLSDDDLQMFYPSNYSQWTMDVIGGHQNLMLRELIRGKSLAV